jgi:NAD(P)-dependent dehydrogenase (short-subunit alcohol dehydrogenase family)
MIKTVVITGASRGIGLDTAMQILHQGHRVIGCGRNPASLEKLLNTARKSGRDQQLLLVELDLESYTSIDRAVAAVAASGYPVDVLINNAGMLVNKGIAAISESELEQVYKVNVLGPFRLVQQLLPVFNTTTTSHIVNISSMGGFQGSAKFPGLSAYSSSKAAIANLAEMWAVELQDKGIRSNALAIGAAQTDMLSAAFPGYQAPLTSSEMAEFIAWFALHGSRFFNGKVLPVAVSTP